jgi:hypothetical protein
VFFFWYDVCLYICTVQLIYELGYIIPCVDKLREQNSNEYTSHGVQIPEIFLQKYLRLSNACTMWSAGFYLPCYLACKACPVVDIMEHEYNWNELNWTVYVTNSLMMDPHSHVDGTRAHVYTHQFISTIPEVTPHGRGKAVYVCN